MEEKPLSEEIVQRLRDRWNAGIRSRLVSALNEGASLASVVESMSGEAETPEPCPEGYLDLRGIDLSHLNLRGPWKVQGEERFRTGVALERVDLSHADLSWALLPRAVLRGSILRYADLNHAELIYADLSGADLSGADLRGAWLLYTQLYDAVVTEEQLASRRNLGQMDFDYHAYER